MKIFIYKTLVIFLLIFITFHLTFNFAIRNVERKIENIGSKENIEVYKEEIRKQLLNSINKDDLIIICTYAEIDQNKAKEHEPKLIYFKENSNIINEVKSQIPTQKNNVVSL